MTTKYQWTPTGVAGFERALPQRGMLLTSDQSGSISRAFALQVAQKAERSIRLVSPLVESQRVVDLLRAARQRHVQVHLLTELSTDRRDGTPRFVSVGMRPEPQDKDNRSHGLCRRLLGEALVHCRSCPNYVHAKLWIVDDKEAFFGSVNLTDNSLGATPGSMEAMLRLVDPKTVGVLRDSFDALWKYTPFRQHLHGEHLLIERKDKTVCPISPDALSVQIHAGLVLHWNIPGQRAALLRGIEDMIERARNQIVLCARSFVDLHEVPRLLDVLHAALQRGVKIAAVVAQDALSEEQYPDAPTRQLLDAGLVLRGWPGLHVKGILVDDHAVAILSANYNPSLSIANPDANIECGIICETGESPFMEFGHYLAILADKAPYALTREKA